MAIRQMDDHLASVIRRSRVRAAELGELTPKVSGPIESAFSPEAQRILRDWLSDGGYARALTLVAMDDPELAVQ